MKEKLIGEIVEHLRENIAKEDLKEFDKMKVAKKFEAHINNEMKDLNEEESVYFLEKLKLSIEQADSGYKFDDIDHKNIDMFSNINNLIINIEDNKKSYSLEELLRKCSLKQLNLYNAFYNYTYDIYNVEKIKDKEKLISNLEKDIIFGFRKYIKRAKNEEINLLKKALKNNGIVDDISEDLIQLGWFIPFKFGKGRRKYIMSKDLLDIIKKHDFSVTSEETKSAVFELLDYLVASKGIVSHDEVEKFIIDASDMNIKKDELFEIANNKFSKRDDYYYVEKIVDSKLFNELVKVKEENPYIPHYEEIMELKMMLNELFTLLIGISGTEVKMGRILKDMFYKPRDVEVLVKKLSKKLKISKDDEDALEEFLYENIFDFPYWIYNGDSDDLNEDFFGIEGFEGLDFDDLDIDGDFEIDEKDLPF